MEQSNFEYQQRWAIAQGASFPDAVTLPESLADFLHCAAETSGSIRYLQQDGTEIIESYRELHQIATAIAGGLRHQGVNHSDFVILQTSNPVDFVRGFWGVVFCGGIPVPIPAQVSSLTAAETLLNPAAVITDHSSSSGKQFSVQQFWGKKENLSAIALPASKLEDLALLLLTSGSTGSPKGVMLTQQNLRVSAYGMAQKNNFQPDEITLNWMPLEHVASLVMFHLTPMYLGCSQIQVANELILKSPLTWLDLIDTYRVTATWAPNFAYGLVNDQADTIAQRQWDLSCLRWMGNGAEAVVSQTTRRFLQWLIPYGLGEKVISPGYGMSETASGIVHSHAFSLDTTSDDDSWVEVGTPIPGVAVRIADEADQVVTEGAIGQLQVKGLTVMAGYYQRPDLNEIIFTADGWLKTGDLGFIENGRLTITGRQKDVIVLNGINYYSHEIEKIVENLEGIAVSFTAACAVKGSDETADQLAIFFHPLAAFQAEKTLLIRQIRTAIIKELGIAPTYIIPVEPEEIPKTSLGKIQRNVLGKRFANGEFQGHIQEITEALEAERKQKHQRPQTELELQMAEIWKSVLGVSTVGSDDNFFELGGTSLRLMQVLHQIQSQITPNISAVELFTYPTIATLAQYLTHSQASSETGKASLRPRSQKPEQSDIAIIGMAGRFPSAENLDAFWRNLCQGKEAITFFEEEELLNSGLDPSLIRNPNYVKASPILENVETFDADFFGYSPKEAELLDPQHRLLLECAWESLETAGYNPFTYPGLIGLYAGASMNTYLLNQVYPQRHQLDANDSLDVFTLSSLGGFQTTVANDKDYLTTRVSYKLNLRGPSVNVQTACSTSLVAIHLAAQSILQGECDLALAGGASVEVPQKTGYLYQEGMILSPDGHCRAFDAQGQGTLFGSGVGLVVLKSWEAAIADGDFIYAKIKGSAVGNDGGQKVGYFAPRSEGQATVMTEALARANVSPETLSYVEAHGTGTPLGDPIEVAGLTQAFRLSTAARQFCSIGSVKTNVGHLNIASGVVGFIKTVLALHYRQIPASLHFHQPNPQIDFANSPFYVNSKLTPWLKQDTPRRAGVNALGIGGTNAHVILEEADLPQKEPSALPDTTIFTVSARSESALLELVKRYLKFLEEAGEPSLADICFTASVGRSHFSHRLAFVVSSLSQLQQALENSLREGKISSASPTAIAFVFSGKTLPPLKQVQALLDTYPHFQATFNHCATVLEARDIDLLELLRLQTLSTAEEEALIFTVEYSLAQLWIDWGIQPSAVFGSGVGEYVAASLAGVLSLEDALRLVVARSQPNTFDKIVETVTYHPPVLPMVASVTGELNEDAIASREYWQKPEQQSVTEGIKALENNGYSTFLECGSPLEFKATDSQHWLRSLSSQDSTTLPLLNSLAILYQQGHGVNWENFYAHREQRRIPLPTYPFQRQRYWLERDLTSDSPQSAGHPLLGELISTPLQQELFQQTVSKTSPRFLQDHQIQGETIFPGAGYLEMALAAGSKVLQNSSLQLREVVMARSLPLLSSSHKLQTILTPESEGYRFEIYSSADEIEWTLHCEGKIIGEAMPSPDSISISAKTQLLAHQYSATTHYQMCEQRGLDYSNQFQAVKTIWCQEREALGEIALSEEIKAELGSYHLPPSLLDSCLQVVLATVPASDPSAVYLPVSLDRFQYHQPIPNQTSSLYSYVQLETATNDDYSEFKAEVWILDTTGQVMVSISGLLTKRVSHHTVSSPPWHNWLYEMAWHSRPPEIFTSNANWGSWLLIGNQWDDLSAIAQRWEADNISCVIFHISEQNFDQKQLENLLMSREDWQGIIFLPEAGTIIPQNSQNICETALGLVQTILKPFQEEFPPQLWLITRGAQAVLAKEALSLAQSPLWGMGRTVMLEHPELNCLCLDLDPNADSKQTLDDLTTELKVRVSATTAKASQIAYREGNRYQSQLVQAPISPKRTPNSTQQLQISRRGLLDNLGWEPIARKKPEAGEVEIQVEVAGLNFRDVLDALGVYPGQSQALGLECVGTIVAVGSGVSHFQIGDPVIAIAPGSFSQFVTVSSALVVSKPKNLTSQAAATIPVTFLSAYYALCQVAQLTQRDRVLIHTAAGGVGQAAIQLAQQVGAKIFATASPQKWAFLKQQGISQIYNSRTSDFAEQIKEDTDGEGVTVVLNTLSGETIPKSLSVLATGGRFLEIGKIDIWSRDKVAQVRPDIAYHVIDLVAITNHHPQQIQIMFSRLAEEFTARKLSPLPVSCFNATEVVDAFRWMQQGNHIGKVVVAPPQPVISSEATYLITGGTGALGIQVAQRLAAQGARYFLLVGRHSPSEAVHQAIAQLEKMGATVRLLQADVGDCRALKKLLSPSDLPPLKGVFHLAGTIDDGILQQQTGSQLETVMKPKVAGAWHLHQLTQELELDHFVLFSSAASVLGSAGQGNYAAANAFLDAIAHLRHQQGLPALSINWAAWSGMGMAKQQPDRNPIASLPLNVGLDILMTLLGEQTPQISVLPEKQGEAVSSPSSPTSILEEVLNAEGEERFTLLYNYLRQQVAIVLGIEATALNDPHCGFTDLGIDSLTSVELRNRLQSSLNCYLPTTLIYDYPTLVDLTNYMMSLISPSPASSQATSEIEPDAVENLSEEEAEALLQEVLKENQD